MDIAVSYDQPLRVERRPSAKFWSYDLNLPVQYISSNYLGNTVASYISDLYWTPNETIMVGIGQSITQITPIAAARYVSAIANGGTVFDAQIIDKIIAPDGTVVLDKEPVVANQIDTDPVYFELIQEGMENVTSVENDGTAAEQFKNSKYPSPPRPALRKERRSTWKTIPGWCAMRRRTIPRSPWWSTSRTATAGARSAAAGDLHHYLLPGQLWRLRNDDRVPASFPSPS